jgi:trehalose 6-phosphate phosphatase
MTGLPAELDAALAEFAARRPLLVASDYDGVLARLREVPSAAVPEPGVAEALARLAAVDGVTVALVSGRGVRDLQATSGLSGPFRWVGSHGAEYDGPLSGELADRRDALAELLAPVVAGVPGALLEVKPASVAVHVRQVRDRALAAALLEEAAGRVDSSLTLKPGKEVLEIAVTDADKGTADRRPGRRRVDVPRGRRHRRGRLPRAGSGRPDGQDRQRRDRRPLPRRRSRRSPRRTAPSGRPARLRAAVARVSAAGRGDRSFRNVSAPRRVDNGGRTRPRPGNSP